MSEANITAASVASNNSNEHSSTETSSSNYADPSKTTATKTSPSTAYIQPIDEEERHMNDSTMPPPRFNKSAGAITSSASRKTAVNVRERGVKKGFGLHDWKRLLMSSGDLAQRKGQPLRRDITLQEVKLHNKEYDGWMILRGRVYNIGPYMHYHPGGVRVLKGLLGKDGTALFDKYHRWVNIDGLIGPLLLGTLAKPTNSDRQPMPAYPSQIIPSGTANLPNAPRVPTKSHVTSGTSKTTQTLFLPRPDDDSESDSDSEEDLLPPPPSRS